MLKALVGALVAANLAFFAWSEGAFDGLIGAPTWRSTGDREPERLKRQVHADRIRVLPAGAASQAMMPVPMTCLETGPFSIDSELEAARAAVLTIVAADGLELRRTERPAEWGVYMGRYAATGALQRKEDELQRRGISYEEISASETLAPGLLLGRFADRPAATQALNDMVARGVKTARVTQLAEATADSRLRVSRADAGVATRLKALTGHEAMAGRAFGDCATPP